MIAHPLHPRHLGLPAGGGGARPCATPGILAPKANNVDTANVAPRRPPPIVAIFFSSSLPPLFLGRDDPYPPIVVVVIVASCAAMSSRKATAAATANVRLSRMLPGPAALLCAALVSAASSTGPPIPLPPADVDNAVGHRRRHHRRRPGNESDNQAFIWLYAKVADSNGGTAGVIVIVATVVLTTVRHAQFPGGEPGKDQHRVVVV